MIKGLLAFRSQSSSLRNSIITPDPTRMMRCHEAGNAKLSAFALQQMVALMSCCSHEVAASG